MTFARLLTLIDISLGASVVSAATTATPDGVVCKTGQQTAHAACCALFPIVYRLQEDLFDGAKCGEDAHSALRLAFHDAIGFSIHGGKGGGADGSILVFNKTENAFPANGGIHLAAAVGTANCPGAPRLQFFMGRPAPKDAAPDHTVPEPADSVSKILKRFEDAGFSAQEVVALLASHTIAAADFLDKDIPGTPFDSTPSTFDSQFFLEVLLKGKLLPGPSTIPKTGEVLSPLAGEMRLQSDFAIARDSRTACFWQEMIDNQAHMLSQFKNAMAKMQVLGQDVKKLIDCSDVIPIPEKFNERIKFPATFRTKDLQLSSTKCGKPFPKIGTVKGPAPTITPVPSKKDD